MAAQMAASIRAMEERQASINTQTEEFVDQIRQLVQSSQAETQQKLQATLDSIGQQMTTILSKLSESQAKVFEDNRAREQSMADRASNAVSEMTGSVEAAVKEISAASQTMAQSVSTLTAATASTVDKMSAGANRLDTAATNFAAAGDRVTSAMGQAATVSGKLTELSGALTTSSGALQEALRDYKSQRDAVSALLGDVRATVELAKKEVSLTGDVLQRIETSTTKLSQAQKAADEYLDGVSQVLADSSDAFRESVVSTLAKVNHDFHTKLSSAVGLLSTAVQELEVTLGGSLAARR
jgi:chromosome segregation ATPase